MRTETITAVTAVTIDTTLTLDQSGRITVSATLPSHGNAVFTFIGTLDHQDGSWFITERGRDGTESAVLFADTKKEALVRFAKRATQHAAHWATA